MVNLLNPKTWEAEVGVFLSFQKRPALSTERVLEQLNLHEETPSQNKEANQKVFYYEAYSFVIFTVKVLLQNNVFPLF